MASEKSHSNESDDENMGGNKLMYDRDIPGYDPRDLQYCKQFVDLAIDFYNKQHSTNYRVVELIRAIVCPCAGFYYGMKFTAKLDGDDAVTFAAEVYEGIEEVTVESVGMVVEGEKLPVDTLRASYS